MATFLHDETNSRRKQWATVSRNPGTWSQHPCVSSAVVAKGQTDSSWVRANGDQLRSGRASGLHGSMVRRAIQWYGVRNENRSNKINNLNLNAEGVKPTALPISIDRQDEAKARAKLPRLDYREQLRFGLTALAMAAYAEERADRHSVAQSTTSILRLQRSPSVSGSLSTLITACIQGR
ncbi:uncharacterized protein J4E79_008593 [Alternaria viburni]|uniref:uncharacterized protein n=1 Tax=Alternaria viburni TaxID=566460 RepID=UPI0020C4D615|nr:uncharacterized protein J4E79_008593 [Alternaria viburni]KAI4653080.1 hypothetical protein J4E79_008593 [Alternaria viburni]